MELAVGGFAAQRHEVAEGERVLERVGGTKRGSVRSTGQEQRQGTLARQGRLNASAMVAQGTRNPGTFQPPATNSFAQNKLEPLMDP